MAKRFGPIDKLSSAKKFKLDVSVCNGQLNSATSNMVDFWANDDDDFVLMATQIAEEKQQQPYAIGNTANVFTSTQKMFPNDMLNIGLPTSLSVEEIFGTDETFVFLPQTTEPEQKPDDDQFETGTSSQMPDGCLNQATKRRQLAQERQLKFLMERVDVLKRENEKLQRDLTDSNNQAGAKEGEVSLLRNELRQARKLLQASKMEKLKLAEEGEKDCNKKVAEVFKQVQAKNAELNFKNVEFSDLKIRNANINERSMSKNTELTATNADECRNLLRIENLCIEEPSTKQFSTKTKGHYEYAKDAFGIKKQRTFFELEFEQLLLNYAQLQAEPNNVGIVEERIIMSACRVFSEFWSYTQSLELPQNCMLYPHNRFDLQSDESTSMRYSLVQQGALYNLEQAVPLRRYIGTLAQICHKQSSISQTLLQKKYGKYWVMQILIEAITKLSYSSEVCEHFGVIEATASFLHSLLSHLNPVMISTCESQLELLFDLLKQLVFTRPSPWVFGELSACLMLCARQDRLMAAMCVNSPNNCFLSDRVRSVYRFGPKSCLIQVYSGLLELCFCSDQPLQPSHFKLLLSICENHVRFVYACFTATPQFILRMLSFPSLTDDEKEDNENQLSKVVGLHSEVTLGNYATTTSSSNVSALAANDISKCSSIPAPDQVPHELGCECYVKLCLSVVTIVFQMMFQWVLQDSKSDISQVGEISHIAVQLLTFIFREYYITSLFRDSEETTKHYLFLLCNWWEDHARLLKFEETHIRFLRQLQDLQFMLRPLHKEANLSNPNNDLAEWTRIVCNADENVSKCVQQTASFNSKTLLSYNASNFFNGLKRIAYNFE